MLLVRFLQPCGNELEQSLRHRQGFSTNNYYIKFIEYSNTTDSSSFYSLDSIIGLFGPLSTAL